MFMRIIAPNGVYLPAKVAVAIDGKSTGTIPFTRCLAKLCIAFADVTNIVGQLKKGANLGVSVNADSDQQIKFGFSLKGLAGGLAALNNI